MKLNHAVGVLILSVFYSSSIAHASIFVRCSEDELGDYESGRKRNAWAVKCGHVRPRFAEELNIDGVYVVLTDRIAPIDPEAECGVPDANVMFCKVSCFAEDEEVLFEDGYQTLKSSAENETPPRLRVAFRIDQEPFRVSWSDEPVDYFIAGEHQGIMYKFTLADEKALKVTRTHPMVMGDATVRAAQDATDHDQLLTVDGPVRIKKVEQVSYDGTVWNVQPVSREPNRNVLVAAGILTGSARYQNEWSDRLNRLALRDRILGRELKR